MEDIQFYMLCTILVVTTGLFTGLWTMIGRHLADRRVRILEADMESVIMTLKSRKGEEARAEKREQRGMAMAGLGMALKADDKKEALTAWAAENPEMVMQFAKKLGIKL